MKPADIILVRGSGPLSDAICKATNSPVSHAAMVVGVNPHIVIEAISPRVAVRPLSRCLNGVKGAWILRRKDPWFDGKRAAIVNDALSYCDDQYGWIDLMLQGLDAIGKTTIVTDLLAGPILKHWPICSYIPARAYDDNEETLVGVPVQDTTPANLYDAPTTNNLLALESLYLTNS